MRVRYVNVDIGWKNAACLFLVFRFSFVFVVVSVRKDREEQQRRTAHRHKNFYEKKGEGIQGYVTEETYILALGGCGRTRRGHDLDRSTHGTVIKKEG